MKNNLKSFKLNESKFFSQKLIKFQIINLKMDNYINTNQTEILKMNHNRVHPNVGLDLWGIQVKDIDQITGEQRQPELFALVFQIPIWIAMDLFEQILEGVYGAGKVNAEKFLTAGGIAIGVPAFLGGGTLTFGLAGSLFLGTFIAGFVTAMEEYDGWTWLENWFNEEWPKLELEITNFFATLQEEYKEISSYRATDDANFSGAKTGEVKVNSPTNYSKWSVSIGPSTFLDQE